MQNGCQLTILKNPWAEKRAFKSSCKNIRLDICITNNMDQVTYVIETDGCERGFNTEHLGVIENRSDLFVVRFQKFDVQFLDHIKVFIVSSRFARWPAC